MMFEPTEEDIRFAIANARWGAAHEQRWITISAVLMSVTLFVAIVLGRPWMLVGAAVFASNVNRGMKARNRELLRLHRLGALRWLAGDPAEYGSALKGRRAD